MSSKSKGINAERELIHLFWGCGWVSARVAGSGSSTYPSCDILASNRTRKLAIECKITKDKSKYFEKEAIKQFKKFADAFGAEPWIAIKFKGNDWHFISLEDMGETNKCFIIDENISRNKGLLFEELTKE